ncbi:MAG: IS21 family transposase, partial [Candidatus Thiothrix moscowensis]|nr:IS21 family transposase [Candidatus Thiothrix moscowensis]
METIGKVRRRKLVKQESISGIARDLKLSRNTVRKYLKADTEPAYRRSLQPCPRLGNFQDTLTTWLEQESALPKRQRRSAQR